MALPRIIVVIFALAGAGVVAQADDHAAPAFSFQETNYFHRWSQGEQHEFTPAKQEDLDHWSDMITINRYPGVDDGDKMAGTANAVLGNYRSHKGNILKTSSVPASDERPAEHFIAVLFSQADFAETAFARFKLVDGQAHSFVYSHRIYGKNATDEMNAWLRANGEKTENALLDWEPPTLSKD